MKMFGGFMRGVNLGGWLSQCVHTREHYDGFITEDDIARISSWGLDHVRLPIDNELIESDSGEYLNGGFAYIDRCIEWCGKHGLNLILDLHKTAGYTFNNAGTDNNSLFSNKLLQERFIGIWQEFSRRYSYLGQSVAFELLNEIVEYEYCDAWNELAKKTVSVIRKNAPDTKIIIGGVRWNSVRSVPLLLPPYDENIVYTFHCYEPMIFTHQKAHWMKMMPPEQNMNYPVSMGEIVKASAALGGDFTEIFEDCGDIETASAVIFERIFKAAAGKAEKHGIPLYCGEYGVIEKAPAEDTLRWYKDIGEAFKSYGIGRAAWTYKGIDFGLTDPHYETVLDEIVKIL